MAQRFIFVIHFYLHHLATVFFRPFFNRRGSASSLNSCNMLFPLHSTACLEKNNLCNCTGPEEIWGDCTRLKSPFLNVMVVIEQIVNISI